MAQENNRGTRYWLENVTENIINADFKDDAAFLKGLTEFLYKQAETKEYATFDFVFRRLLFEKPEYNTVKPEELVHLISKKCSEINDKSKADAVKKRILSLLKSSNVIPNRQSIMEMAIVLGFDLADLNNLYQKGLFQTGVSYSSYAELIGVYAIINKLSLNEFYFLIEKFEMMASNIGIGDYEVYDTGSAYFEDHMMQMAEMSKDEFVNYLGEKAPALKDFSMRCVKVYKSLFEEVALFIGHDYWLTKAARMQLFNYLERSLRHPKGSTVESVITELKKMVEEALDNAYESLDRCSDENRLYAYKRPDYAAVREHFRHVHRAYGNKNADETEFDTLLKAAFPSLNNENVIRTIYGGRYSDGGIMKDRGRTGVNVKKAELPKQVLESVMAPERLSHIMNMVEEHQDYYTRLDKLKTRYPGLSLKDISALDKEAKCEVNALKRAESCLRIPTRHELLQLIYFLCANQSLDSKERVETFIGYGTEKLKLAGYLGVYAGCLEDILFIGLLSSDDELTYNELIRYALGEKDY